MWILDHLDLCFIMFHQAFSFMKDMMMHTTSVNPTVQQPEPSRKTPSAEIEKRKQVTNRFCRRKLLANKHPLKSIYPQCPMKIALDKKSKQVPRPTIHSRNMKIKAISSGVGLRDHQNTLSKVGCMTCCPMLHSCRRKHLQSIRHCCSTHLSERVTNGHVSISKISCHWWIWNRHWSHAECSPLYIYASSFTISISVQQDRV